MEKDFTRILKAKDLSLTSVRLALLEVLHEHPHSDANHIFEWVKKKIPSASLQAIYNNLHTLVQSDILREIKPKGQVSLYEMHGHDNHHHLVCRHCDAIIDVACHGCAPCLSPSDNHGFVIDEAEVIFWGLCPACNHSSK